MKKIILIIVSFICSNTLLGQCKYVWATWTDQGQTDSATASLVVNGHTIDMTMTANYNFGFGSFIYGYKAFNNFADRPPNATVPQTTWSIGSGGKTTMCFSEPVINPSLLLSSIGNSGNPVTLNFSLPYKVVFDGGGNKFVNSKTITGYEGNCIIEFPGTFTCITIFSNTSEVYTNITWGIKNTLTAGFLFDNVCEGDSIPFLNTSTINSPGKITDYHWDFGDGDTSALLNPTHLYAKAGNYKVGLTATSDNLCTDVIYSNVIVYPKYNLNNNQTICTGQSYPINSHNYNTSGIYNDTFKTIFGCDSIIITNLNIQAPLPAKNVFVSICSGTSYQLPSGKKVDTIGIYTDSLKTSNGCDSVIITTLSFFPQMEDSVNIKNVSCFGNTDGQIKIFAFNGTAPYSFNIVDIGTNINGIFTKLLPNKYNYTITDKNGCSITGNSTITQPKEIKITVKPNDTLIDAYQIVNLIASCNYSNASYLWSPSNFLSCDTGYNIISTPDSNMIYKLETSVLINGKTCKADTTATIHINPTLYLPNAFTPNDDGLNDFFQIEGTNLDNIYDFEIKIYDRWGEGVYTSNDVYFKWDGINVSGQRIEVYLYHVQYSIKSKKILEHKTGNITLIK